MHHCRLSWSRHLPPHVPPSKLTSYLPLANHHRGPCRPTTTSHDPLSPVSPWSPPCPICEPPPTRYVRAASPYASPHADPPPFMHAALHACHLPVPPPSHAQALHLMMAEPLPRTRLPCPWQILCQCHRTAICHDKSPCPVPAAVAQAVQTRTAPPVTPMCCRTPAPTAGGVSTSSTASVMSHVSSTSSRWMHGIIFGRHTRPSSFNSGMASGPRPAAGWFLCRSVSVHAGCGRGSKP